MGIVKMYDEEMFLDLTTGIGVDKVIKKIDPLINKWASSVSFGDMLFEDRRQEIYIIAIQGIYKYDCNKNTKLSSFLHTHIKNKVLSKIRSVNKKSNNAITYNSEDSGFLREIPESQIVLSSTEESRETLFDVYEDTSDYSIISNKNIIMEQLEGAVTEDEFKIIKMLITGMSIKEISESMGMRYWTTSKCVKRLRESKALKDVL